MSADQAAPITIDAAVAAFPPKVYALLEQIRATIRGTVPPNHRPLLRNQPPLQPDAGCLFGNALWIGVGVHLVAAAA